MIPKIFWIRKINGEEEMVNRHRLEELRMLMDWQLRQQNYNPTSVVEACRLADGEQSERSE